MIHGITRSVFLTRRWAIKIPTFRSWSLFLHGLLANMQEAFWWSATHDSRLCPVRFSVPGGFLVIMERANPVENENIPYEEYEGLPLDPKPTNFGMLRGKLVLLDYGS